jgi:hypothetical protein
MITREQLKKEIEFVREEYLFPLYKIIKTFEKPIEAIDLRADQNTGKSKKEEWQRFVEKFAGCLADTPIERGDQGKFELRSRLKVLIDKDR